MANTHQTVADTLSAISAAANRRADDMLCMANKYIPNEIAKDRDRIAVLEARIRDNETRIERMLAHAKVEAERAEAIASRCDRVAELIGDMD